MTKDLDQVYDTVDMKGETEHHEIDETSVAAELTDLQKEIAIVAALSDEEYTLTEKKLVRKIDRRLLPCPPCSFCWFSTTWIAMRLRTSKDILVTARVLR